MREKAADASRPLLPNRFLSSLSSDLRPAPHPEVPRSGLEGCSRKRAGSGGSFDASASLQHLRMRGRVGRMRMAYAAVRRSTIRAR
ncbi:hypothetical protein E4V01_20840 [Methylorubrum sp. Q1]|nr:hypothetical protein E4V01_20840 [Methylorubrum sp. Q1]